MDDNRLPGEEEREAEQPPLVEDGGGVETAGFTIRIIRNPRSRRNAGAPSASNPQDPEIIEPRRGDTAAALRRCRDAGTDCLVIDGGDGTVRDVLTAGLGVFGDNWPAIAVLPRGKTNALAHDLGVPDGWTWREAAQAARRGRTAARRPLILRRADGAEPPVAGFLVGAGSFATGIEAAQDAHRLGMFGGLAVGMTVGWAVLQVLLGGARNQWRRGQEMDIRLPPDGRPLPNRGGGEPGRRSLLLATTLTRMPLGFRPLGREREGLKLLVVDRALRRMYGAAPLILAGRSPGWLRRRGLHQLDADGLEVRFTERFILDGEFLPPGSWRIEQGPVLRFVTP